MLRAIARRLTYANVMASIAVFLALGGGAYALTIPRNSVGSAQLKSNAVTRAKIARNAVDSLRVRDGSLQRADLAPGLLTSGPRGETGATGATGPQGPQGQTGQTGPRGPSQLIFDEASSGGAISSTMYLNNRNYAIPAGTWWLTWSGQADTASVAGITLTCRLSVSNVALDEKSVGLSATTDSAALVLAAPVTGPVTVSQQCRVSLAAQSAVVRSYRFSAVTADTVTDLSP